MPPKSVTAPSFVCVCCFIFLNCARIYLLSLHLFSLPSSSLSPLLPHYFYLLANGILSFATVMMMKYLRRGNSRHHFPLCPFPPPLTHEACFISSTLHLQQQSSGVPGEHQRGASRCGSDEGWQEGPAALADLLQRPIVLQTEQGEGWLSECFPPSHLRVLYCDRQIALSLWHRWRS